MFLIRKFITDQIWPDSQKIFPFKKHFLSNVCSGNQKCHFGQILAILAHFGLILVHFGLFSASEMFFAIQIFVALQLSIKYVLKCASLSLRIPARSLSSCNAANIWITLRQNSHCNSNVQMQLNFCCISACEFQPVVCRVDAANIWIASRQNSQPKLE